MYSASNGGSLRMNTQSNSPSSCTLGAPSSNHFSGFGKTCSGRPRPSATPSRRNRSDCSKYVSCQPRAAAASNIASVESFANLIFAIGSITTARLRVFDIDNSNLKNVT